MNKRPRRLTLGPSQGQTLQVLRKHLATRRYFIFPVAPWCGRHKNDFVAVEKGVEHGTPKVVLVRVGLHRGASRGRKTFKRVVLVNAYVGGTHLAEQIIRDMQARCVAPLRLDTNRFRPPNRGRDGWLALLPKKQQEEYRQLNPSGDAKYPSTKSLHQPSTGPIGELELIIGEGIVIKTWKGGKNQRRPG